MEYLPSLMSSFIAELSSKLSSVSLSASNLGTYQTRTNLNLIRFCTVIMPKVKCHLKSSSIKTTIAKEAQPDSSSYLPALQVQSEDNGQNFIDENDIALLEKIVEKMKVLSFPVLMPPSMDKNIFITTICQRRI